MGYHTDFSGEFSVTPGLKPEHKTYLEHFSRSRRVKRNPKLTKDIEESNKNTIRLDAGLPLGKDSGYYVDIENFGQNQTNDITDYNTPPAGQPELWCQWIPTEDGTAIEWDQGENFYNYVDWIEYLIKHFLEPWGYKLNGKVKWIGSNTDDFGTISIKDNAVTIIKAIYCNDNDYETENVLSITLELIGDFFEANGESAKLLHDHLGVTTTTKNKKTLAGFPVSTCAGYFRKITEKGINVIVKGSKI